MMTSKIDNLTKLLSKEDNGSEGEVFDFIYRGSSEIDRHYTKPMLPWIISEIKDQHKLLQVMVVIKNGCFEVKDKETQKVLLTHTMKQIHKCVMEQADHRCFLYTLRSSDNKDPTQDGSEYWTTPPPSNIHTNQNYHCHLYQALTEQEVRSFFGCLRQQPREGKIPENESLNALADLSVHMDSRFFEVLFVGRVKVSHCKVPVTFIDEALTAFRQKEKTRQRHASGEGKHCSSPSRLVMFQQEGSGYSVPNIPLKNLFETDTSMRSRSSSRDLSQGESSGRREKDGRNSKVRFNLGGSADSPEEPGESYSPMGGLSPQSSVSSASSYHLCVDLQELEKEARSRSPSSHQGFRHLARGGSADADLGTGFISSEQRSSLSRHAESPGGSATVPPPNGEEPCCGTPSELLSFDPTKRVRTTSITECNATLAEVTSVGSNQGIRSRSGSIGSIVSKNRGIRPSEADLKALGYDFNRTMLFHIGYREIQLINPELKSVQLHKPFKDVAGFCQGMKSKDHFGFICREMNGDTMAYVGYIFRCDKSSVVDDIIMVLNCAFSAMHEAHQRDRKEHLMCDFCPLKWFSQVCAEVEGMPAPKAHSVLMRKVSSLPEDDRDLIIAKYEGAETSDLAQKNNVLMMLLRTHFEYKQASHSHPTESESSYQRSESLLGANLEESLKKAKKSITTSFNHLLKKREGDSAERDIAKSVEEIPRTSPTRTLADEKTSDPTSKQSPSSFTSGGSYILEHISDSPLKSYRGRSSTVSGAGADSIRKELMAQKSLFCRKKSEEVPEPPPDPPTSPKKKNSGPKMNIFLKFGTPSHAEESSVEKDLLHNTKPPTSFRQSILQKVVSPPKGMPDTPNRKVDEEMIERKISTGILSKKDKAIQSLRKRTIDELMLLWKKAIFQQILLLRIERENQRLRALQKEAALQKVRLNYEEDELPIEAQQTWELLLSHPHYRIDTNVLYSGIKQGVPKLVRGEVWHLLMVQQQMFHQTPRHKQTYPKFYLTPYEDILKELTSQQHAILTDLGRTFPGHPYFTQTLGPGQLALFNILKAYSIVDSEVGYCQGLSFVGGILLMHVEEELAYELLKYLMFDSDCRKQYLPDSDGLLVRMYQLTRLMHDKLKDLLEHLEAHEVTPQLYAAPWFITIYSSQFPQNFVGRVFDLLFLLGMEAVFNVALVLLETHQQELLSLANFEQIMDYLKNTVPNIQPSQLDSFFAEVCECSVKAELAAYEVEFQVMREEICFSPQQDVNLNKLKEANRNLKRQNLDLLEDLQVAKARQQTLESSTQSLQQNQHHLEVRVRWLEMEKNNMRQVIHILSRNASKEMFEAVPLNLERYLPHKASSPRPDDRGSFPSHISPLRVRSRSPSPGHSRHEAPSPPKDFSLDIPHHASVSGQLSRKDKDPPQPSLNPKCQTRPRASTLDSQSLQNYYKNYIKTD